MPRLELCAALLHANLYAKVVSCLGITITSTFLWTDSSIVLSWVRKSSHLFKTFVANRVAEIHELTKVSYWCHVASVDNPADCLSRGMYADELMDWTLCWAGPPWLYNIDLDPTPYCCDNNDLPELRAIHVGLNYESDPGVLLNCSSFLNFDHTGHSE